MLPRAAHQRRSIISSRVFVGNLNYETTQGDLETLFSEVGDVVEVFLPSDRNTGRPRGFAFVEFADDASVADAIEKFDGHELGGRSLRISEAEDRPQRRPPRMPMGDMDGEPGFGGHHGGGHGQKGRPKPKGSRRNFRSKKRSL